MLKEARREKIIEIINNNKSIRTSELCKILNVTHETIRRDLKYLSQHNMIKKTFGGAVIVEKNRAQTFKTTDISFDIRNSTNVSEKESIAKSAASYIEPGDTIALDASTTTLHMLNYIPENKGITVITNSLSILCGLAGKKGIDIISVGGLYRNVSTSFLGSTTVNSVDGYNINKVFLSGHAVSLELGLTDPHEQEVNFKRKLIEKAQVRFLLADHSKFGLVAVFSTCPLTSFNMIISDSQLSDNIMKQIQNLNVKVVKAE